MQLFGCLDVSSGQAELTQTTVPLGQAPLERGFSPFRAAGAQCCPLRAFLAAGTAKEAADEAIGSALS
uniref:Uncharacterized protein n=1 Tax=Arundo donax TaxID=35708 RepID=A0A0A8XVQ5_ARUDO